MIHLNQLMFQCIFMRYTMNNDYFRSSRTFISCPDTFFAHVLMLNSSLLLNVMPMEKVGHWSASANDLPEVVTSFLAKSDPAVNLAFSSCSRMSFTLSHSFNLKFFTNFFCKAW